VARVEDKDTQLPDPICSMLNMSRIAFARKLPDVLLVSDFAQDREIQRGVYFRFPVINTPLQTRVSSDRPLRPAF
jgi:hypothetical protein